MQVKDWIQIASILFLLAWNIYQEWSRRKQSKELTSLKAKYEWLHVVKKASFQTEFNLYKEIWSKVCDVIRQMKDYRLQIDAVLISGRNILDEDIKKQIKIGQDSIESFQELENEIEKKRPFYPKNIRTHLWKFLTYSTTFHTEEISKLNKQISINNLTPDSIDKLKKRTIFLEDLSVKVENAIRKRLAFLNQE